MIFMFFCSSLAHRIFRKDLTYYVEQSRRKFNAPEAVRYISEADALQFVATGVLPAPPPPLPTVLLTVAGQPAVGGPSFRFTMLSGRELGIYNGDLPMAEAIPRLHQRIGGSGDYAL